MAKKGTQAKTGNPILAAKVKYLRLQAKLTQEELGDRCNVSENFVWMVEHARRNLSGTTLADFARALGVLEADLLTPPPGEIPGETEPAADDGLLPEALQRMLLRLPKEDQQPTTEELQELRVLRFRHGVGTWESYLHELRKIRSEQRAKPDSAKKNDAEK